MKFQSILNKSNFQSLIEGYYDAKERTIYLHLKGFLDATFLIDEYDKFLEKQERKDFLSAWTQMRNVYAKGVLVLFHLSHVLILTHPTPTFDNSYINLFRALDIIRSENKMLMII